MNIKIKRYGWQPDLPDKRDFLFSQFVKVGVLPSKVDLRKLCSPVENQGQLGSCHDADTEVLTEDGWKLFADLSGSERLATVNSETAELIYEKPSRLISFDYSGKMYSASHQFLNFRVTPDHNMLVRKWNEKTRTVSSSYEFVQAKNIGWYSSLMNRIIWNGDSPSDVYTLPGVPHKRKEQRKSKTVPMLVWLRFLGIYLAEGTMIKRNQYPGRVSYKFQIAASEEDVKTFVRETLAALGVHALELKDRFTFSNRRIYEAMSSLGLEGVKAGQKFVPRFVFKQNAAMIREFLMGHFYGDGSEQRGMRCHYTGSERLANDLQRLIFLSGDESRMSVRPGRKSKMKDGRIVIGRLNEYRVSVCERKNLSIDRKESIRVEDYKGKVYCAEMKRYHTLVTRRKSKILISGNCTANALVGNLEFLEVKDKMSLIDLSRLFVYYNERVIEDTVDFDSGATLRDGIKTLKKWGVCNEKIYPYIISKFTQKPSTKAYKDGKNHLIQIYMRITTVDQMKRCLADGFPFVFGFTVYDSFESDAVKKNGIVNLPKPSEKVLGGHAVMAVSYDDSTQRFTIRNSWGSKWGMKGYFTMPYEYLADRNLSDDFWTIRKGENV